MNTKLKRLLLPLLRAAAKGGVITFRMRSAAQQGLFLLGKATPKSKGGRLRRIQKRTGWADETKAIRGAVFARAEGICEVPGCSRAPTVMDHWLGGSGRRLAQQSIETCWAVCGLHNVARTHNTPDAAFWNAAFQLHCAHRGYPFTPHITHAQLKRSTP